MYKVINIDVSVAQNVENGGNSNRIFGWLILMYELLNLVKFNLCTKNDKALSSVAYILRVYLKEVYIVSKFFGRTDHIWNGAHLSI